MSQQTTPDLDVQPEQPIIRVSNGSDPQKVAATIAHTLYEGKRAKVRAIGAGAVNQAVKACAIARGYVAPRGIDLAVRPGFESVEGNNGPASAVVLIVVST